MALKKNKSKRNFGKALVAVVTDCFDRQHKTLKQRNVDEQRLIGDLLTVIEQEIKDELKKMIQ